MKRELIETMFGAVDACDWVGLAAFYHPDCRYDRPGFRTIEGLEALLRFYETDRPIRSGVHRVDEVLDDRDGACAFGGFEGRLRNGEAISLRFADRYVFEDGVIRSRVTYFYAPLA